MTTHRSLNKLERRAHMSIHNKVEVFDVQELRQTGFTSDRFGKKHGISKGTSDKKAENV